MADDLSAYPPPSPSGVGSHDVAEPQTPQHMPSSAVARPCPVCAGEWGPGNVCQSCGQVGGFASGIRLSSAGRRLVAWAIGAAFLVVASVIHFFFPPLGILVILGYAIWAMIAWRQSQSPGKQLLGMRVIDPSLGKRATWGKMCLRDFVLKRLLFGLVALTGVGLIVYFWLLWDESRQQLWDKMAGTLVVNDFDKQL